MPGRNLVLPDEAWVSLIMAAQKDSVYLEGSVLKLLDPGDSPSYQAYLKSATAADKEKRERRLAVTRQVQDQNKELLEAQETIEQKTASLEEALEEMRAAKQDADDALSEATAAREEAVASQLEAERARKEAESAWQDAKNDLDYMQKQTQFELMGRIVRVSLFVIIAVGTVTTSMYAMALFGPKTNAEDVNLLANTWSNMFGILLTNSFSIIGTIMGVKYATESQKQG